MGAFDDSGNYVLSGDEPRMSMAGTGGLGYTQPSRFGSFLNYFTQPQQQGQSQMSRRRTLLGGLSQMNNGQGGGGALGTIGRFASFLV